MALILSVDVNVNALRLKGHLKRRVLLKRNLRGVRRTGNLLNRRPNAPKALRPKGHLKKRVCPKRNHLGVRRRANLLNASVNALKNQRQKQNQKEIKGNQKAKAKLTKRRRTRERRQINRLGAKIKRPRPLFLNLAQKRARSMLSMLKRMKITRILVTLVRIRRKKLIQM